MSTAVAEQIRPVPQQLYLQYQVGPHTCCLPCRWVEQVVPSVALTPVPGAPSLVRGLLRYHGQVVTVIELGALLGQPSAPAKLSTRIILLRPAPGTPGAILGILAENVLNVIPLSAAAFRCPEFTGTGHGLMCGRVADTPNGLIHVLEPGRLLPLGLTHTDTVAGMAINLNPPPGS